MNRIVDCKQLYSFWTFAKNNADSKFAAASMTGEGVEKSQTDSCRRITKRSDADKFSNDNTRTEFLKALGTYMKIPGTDRISGVKFNIEDPYAVNEDKFNKDKLIKLIEEKLGKDVLKSDDFGGDSGKPLSAYRISIICNAAVSYMNPGVNVCGYVKDNCHTELNKFSTYGFLEDPRKVEFDVFNLGKTICHGVRKECRRHFEHLRSHTEEFKQARTEEDITNKLAEIYDKAADLGVALIVDFLDDVYHNTPDALLSFAANLQKTSDACNDGSYAPYKPFVSKLAKALAAKAGNDMSGKGEVVLNDLSHLAADAFVKKEAAKIQMMQVKNVLIEDFERLSPKERQEIAWRLLDIPGMTTPEFEKWEGILTQYDAESAVEVFLHLGGHDSDVVAQLKKSLWNKDRQPTDWEAWIKCIINKNLKSTSHLSAPRKINEAPEIQKMTPIQMQVRNGLIKDFKALSSEKRQEIADWLLAIPGMTDAELEMWGVILTQYDADSAVDAILQMADQYSNAIAILNAGGDVRQPVDWKWLIASIVSENNQKSKPHLLVPQNFNVANYNGFDETLYKQCDALIRSCGENEMLAEVCRQISNQCLLDDIDKKRQEALKKLGYEALPTSGKGNNCLLYATIDEAEYKTDEAEYNDAIAESMRIAFREHISNKAADAEKAKGADLENLVKIEASILDGEMIDLTALPYLAEMLDRPIVCYSFEQADLLKGGDDQKDDNKTSFEPKKLIYDDKGKELSSEESIKANNPIYIGFVENVNDKQSGGHFVRLRQVPVKSS